MERKKVNSSNINSIGYDQIHNILEVEFSSGDIYKYLNVPQNVYILLMSSSSHGSYFADHIKNKFNFIKL